MFHDQYFQLCFGVALAGWMVRRSSIINQWEEEIRFNAKSTSSLVGIFYVNHGQKVISKVDPTGLVVTAWKSLGWAKA